MEGSSNTWCPQHPSKTLPTTTPVLTPYLLTLPRWVSYRRGRAPSRMTSSYNSNKSSSRFSSRNRTKDKQVDSTTLSRLQWCNWWSIKWSLLAIRSNWGIASATTTIASATTTIASATKTTWRPHYHDTYLSPKTNPIKWASSNRVSTTPINKPWCSRRCSFGQVAPCPWCPTPNSNLEQWWTQKMNINSGKRKTVFRVWVTTQINSSANWGPTTRTNMQSVLKRNGNTQSKNWASRN